MNTIQQYTLALLVFFTSCFGSLAAGCDTLGGPGVTWPDAVHCGSRAAGDLLPEVSTIILDDSGDTMSERAKSGLEGLALEHGAGVVACLVDKLVQRWTSPASTPSPARVAAVARAQGWQEEVGTEVRQ